MSAPPGLGIGHAVAHHGEVLQGVFEAPAGRLRRALITMPCSMFGTTARFEPSTEAGVRCSPAWKCKAQRAVELALAHVGARTGGRLVLTSNVPVGHGLGSSTSDVIAAIYAVFHAHHIAPTGTTIAEISVRAECSSDSIMFNDRAVLFAHREGVVLEDFGRPLPALEVLGVLTDPGRPFDTIATSAARYNAAEIDEFRRLLALARRAIEEQSSALLGQLASSSARISQRHLPKKHFDEIERIADRTGALGIQVAHSGTVVGLLYDRGTAHLSERVDESAGLLRGLGLDTSWRFTMPG